MQTFVAKVLSEARGLWSKIHRQQTDFLFLYVDGRTRIINAGKITAAECYFHMT